MAFRKLHISEKECKIMFHYSILLYIIIIWLIFFLIRMSRVIFLTELFPGNSIKLHQLHRLWWDYFSDRSQSYIKTGDKMTFFHASFSFIFLRDSQKYFKTAHLCSYGGFSVYSLEFNKKKKIQHIL